MQKRSGKWSVCDQTCQADADNSYRQVRNNTKENEMKVTEITLARTTRVESDTDAYHILSNQFQLDGYVSQFGNVDVVYDAESKVYRVPSLDAKRSEYCEKKTRDCARWGCE